MFSFQIFTYTFFNLYVASFFDVFFPNLYVQNIFRLQNMLHFRFFINKIFLNYMLVCVYSFKYFSQFIYKKNKKKIKNVEHGIFRKKIEVMWQSKLSGIEVMRQVTVYCLNLSIIYFVAFVSVFVTATHFIRSINSNCSKLKLDCCGQF